MPGGGAVLKKAKQYEDQIRHLVMDNKDATIFEWLRKYPIDHSSRRHLFGIVEEIKSLYPNKDIKILDQGAAEGIILRLLKDDGYDVLGVDIEPGFKNLWKILDVEGIIGDCCKLDWWDGTKYSAIIATVWVTCKGDKNPKNKIIDKEGKIQRLKNIRENWFKMLNKRGVVYFDVNEQKYPLKMVKKVFGRAFETEIFSEKIDTPRVIIRCRKMI